VTSEQADLDRLLSQALNRNVQFVVVERGTIRGVSSSLPPDWAAFSEEFWPDIEGRDHRNTVTDFSLPSGTFFDAALVHVLTAETLAQLQEHYPEGSFDIQRFRPNIVLEPEGHAKGFVEKMHGSARPWRLVMRYG